MRSASPHAQTSQGSLFVVEDACQFAADRRTATIAVESTNEDFPRAIDELKSVAARDLALSYAATEGMGDPRINDNVSHPYAINSKGTPIDKVMENHADDPLPADHALLQPAAYRVDIKVTKPIR